MISREETPFLSSIGKTTAKAIYHEWQTDELVAPGSGAVAEGSTFSTVAGAQTAGGDRTRLGNYTQINSKTVQVSGTKRAVWIGCSKMHISSRSYIKFRHNINLHSG